MLYKKEIRKTEKNQRKNLNKKEKIQINKSFLDWEISYYERHSFSSSSTSISSVSWIFSQNEAR
jgi:isopropylmalate/homocitrate/citramalate synthase